VVLGLISSKVPALEPRETLQRRVREASQYLALEQLAISPQCGFASTVAGNPMTEADERAKLKLVTRDRDGDLGQGVRLPIRARSATRLKRSMSRLNAKPLRDQAYAGPKSG